MTKLHQSVTNHLIFLETVHSSVVKNTLCLFKKNIYCPRQTQTDLFIQVLKCWAHHSGYQQSKN